MAFAGATSGAIAGGRIIATGIIEAATGIVIAADRRPMIVARRRVIGATGTGADLRPMTGRMITIMADGIVAVRRRMIMATAITATGIATAVTCRQMTTIAGTAVVTTEDLRLVPHAARQ